MQLNVGNVLGRIEIRLSWKNRFAIVCPAIVAHRSTISAVGFAEPVRYVQVLVRQRFSSGFGTTVTTFQILATRFAHVHFQFGFVNRAVAASLLWFSSFCTCL